MNKILKIAVCLLLMLSAFRATRLTLADDSGMIGKCPTMQGIIVQYAQQYHVSERQMLGTANCESGFNPNKTGDFDKATGEYTSFGLVQIHLSAHPDVTKAQAFDPDYAADFMAKNFAAGNQHMWTCYRLLYEKA